MLHRFHNMKMARKIAAMVGIASIAVFAVLLVWILSNTYKHAEQTSIDYLQEVADHHAGVVSAELNAIKHMVDRLRDAVVAGRDYGDALSREQVVSQMKSYITDENNIVGLWTIWNENAFDGQDDQYRNKSYHDQTGRFLPYVLHTESGPQVETLRNYDDITQNSYLRLAAESKQSYLVDPYYYEVNGEMILVTSIAVPIFDQAGEVIAVVGADTNVTYLQELAESIIPMSGVTNISTASYQYVAHAGDVQKIGQAVLNPLSVEQVTALSQGKPIVAKGEDNWRAIELISMDGSPMYWVMQIDVPTGEIFANYTVLRSTLILVLALSTLFLIGGFAFIITWMMRPVEIVAEVAERIANGDLTQRVDRKYLNKSETGLLSHAVNTMADKLTDLIGDIQMASAQVHESTNTVREAAGQLSAASNEVSRAIDGIAQGAASQAGDAEDGFHKVTSLAEGVEELQRKAIDMNRSSAEIVEKNNVAMTAIDRLKTQATSSHEASADVQEQIVQLSQKTKGVSQALEAIKHVAAQTNILSLNASIEAARAGEYGSGFAVVADEIRKLANDTAKLADQIGAMMVEMGSNTDHSLRSAAVAKEAEGHLFDAVHEVTEASADISMITDRLVVILQELGHEVDDIGEHNTSVVQAIQNISAVTEQSAASSEEVAASVEEQTAMTEEIARSVQSLQQMTAALAQKTEGFRLK